jgi:metal-dependent amidase/aminoacylase/carboxypeptidase family protein
MINHASAVDLIVQAAGDVIGRENVLPPENNLGAEDFGCFTEVAPGAMYALGCGIEGDERHLHSPSFDLDERCLAVGAAILAETVWRADSVSA